MTRTRKLQDPLLFGLALLITGMGMLFVFDAGYARSLRDGRGIIPREFLMQVPFLALAIIACYAMASISQVAWQKWSKAIWIVSLLSLLLVMIPNPLRIEMSGAHRWIKIGPLLLQPAEFAKLATILYLAGVLADRKAWPSKIKRRKDWAQWLDTVAIPKLKRCLPALWVLFAVVLIEKEPDLGTAAVIAATAAVMFAAGGVTRKTLLVGGLISLLGVGVMIKQEPYRVERIQNHASRWSGENMDDTGYQTVQSELAMASGGIAGVGIGNGRAKHVLPATTTDFIMATVGEEFGLFGSFVVIGLLGALVLRMIMLASRAESQFASLVLIGVAAWIGIQACTNIMMANGFLPAIGIPLPFISSGGSSLISLWLGIGLCQSVLAPVPTKEAEVAPRRHRRWNRRARLSGA
jgi:cell division protein FtsW